MLKCLVLPALLLYSLFVQVTAKPDSACAKEIAQYFHSVMLLPDNHQEEVQNNGNENETMRSSREWTNSEIQK